VPSFRGLWFCSCVKGLVYITVHSSATMLTGDTELAYNN